MSHLVQVNFVFLIHVILCALMGSVRRSTRKEYLIYLGLNVVISAITILVVLNVWDRTRAKPAPTATATIDVLAHVASAVPTITPTVPASPTPHTYTVQPGDTLFGISLELGIPVEALMAANGLTDPNTIDVGQVLVIPSLDSDIFSQPTPIVRQSTAELTATSETEAPSPGVVIFGVEGYGVLEEEYVRLLNQGGEILMAGWTIDDGEGRVYTFPAFNFYSTGAVHVHTRTGDDTTIDLYWGLDEAVWAPGKVITLRDATGVVQSTYQIPES
jgi:LysM repeat protein